MEEAGVENIGKSGLVVAADGPIKRTQSSLELLSDTALGVAESTQQTTLGSGEEPQIHGEESCSGGSANTAASARVTPSISQVSFAGGGANNSDNVSVAATEVHQQEGSGTAPNSAGKSGSSSHGFIPASPYHFQSPMNSSYSETTGLPIDHFPTYPVPQPPMAPTFLPDSYASQAHYYSHHGGSGQHPSSSTSLVPRPMQGSASATFASHGPGGLAAAFAPPRSSTVRLSNQNEATHSPMPQGQTHYLVAMPAGMVPQGAHYSNIVHHHHHQGHHAGPNFGPCESFQSDSTASLASESKLKSLNQKKPQAKHPAQQVIDKPKEKRDMRQGGSTLSDLESENKLLRQQNTELKYELEKRNQEVSVLRGEVRDLDLKVKELRQFPAGKISQIPMADMLEIMQIYGSEVSDTVMPPRKLNIQKASVIRQFRRWNPNFLKHFYFKDGQWIPKLGRDGELARRQVARKKLAKAGGKTSSPSSPVPSEDYMSAPPGQHTPTSLSTPPYVSLSPHKMMTTASDENRKRKYEDRTHG